MEGHLATTWDSSTILTPSFITVMCYLYRSYIVQFSLSLFLDDQVPGGGFHMDVESGSRPDDGRCNKYGIRTRVILVCNSSAKWPGNQDLSALIEVARLEAVDPCEVSC